jgi:hypothetical protein
VVFRTYATSKAHLKIRRCDYLHPERGGRFIKPGVSRP